MTPDFVIANGHLIAVSAIEIIDFSEVEALKIKLTTRTETFNIEGIQAIDCLMQLRPSALENRRLRWAKRAWFVHNMVGHPLMQLLALFGKYRLAMLVHDKTVPRPNVMSL